MRADGGRRRDSAVLALNCRASAMWRSFEERRRSGRIATCRNDDVRTGVDFHQSRSRVFSFHSLSVGDHCKNHPMSSFSVREGVICAIPLMGLLVHCPGSAPARRVITIKAPGRAVDTRAPRHPAPRRQKCGLKACFAATALSIGFQARHASAAVLAGEPGLPSV
jgi:hypothetical protein